MYWVGIVHAPAPLFSVLYITGYTSNPLANMNKQTILVPWDFTQQSETALLHAYQLAQVVGDNILLLHIKKLSRFASKGAKAQAEDELKEVRLKMDREVAQRAEQMQAERGKLEVSLRERGLSNISICDVEIRSMALVTTNLDRSISDLYAQLGVNLIVSARSYTTGGKEYDLLKIMKKAKSSRKESMPFVIVNKPPKHKYYTEIVVPMDHDRKYKETLRWVAYLSHYYHCNVDLIKPAFQDESLKRAMQNNIYFTKKILDTHGVVYGIKTARQDRPFYDEVKGFIKEIDADMVILMTNNLKSLFRREEMDFDVPVMYVKPLSSKLQSFN